MCYKGIAVFPIAPWDTLTAEMNVYPAILHAELAWVHHKQIALPVNHNPK